MIRLWIDLTDFMKWTGNLTGIQRVQYNLAKHFADDSEIDAKFFVYDEQAVAFKEISVDIDSLIKLGIKSGYSQKKESKLKLDKLHLSKRLSKKSEPLIFSESDRVLVTGGMWTGTYMDELVRLKKLVDFKLFHFMYDMIPAYCPGYVVDWLPRVFSDYNAKLFEVVDSLICISESTRRDVKKFINENQINNNPRLSVVRLGDEPIAEQSSLEKIAGIDPGYILSVSTFEVRKNHASLYYAAKLAKTKGITLPKIVIVGRNGWQTSDIRYVIGNDPDINQDIVHLSEVNDAQLAWLYQNCRFTVFPSFYEGWGMPVAESLGYGKMCLSSNVSSMPEIAGDLIDYFNPYDTGELLDRMSKYLDNTILKKAEKQIQKNYRPTTWEDTYLDTKKQILG